MRSIRWRVVAVASALAMVLAGVARVSGQAPPRCADLPAAGWLDFWVGEWTVSVGGQRAGTSRIERVLDGCALLEHWEASRGGAGKSLFYLSPPDGIWKQVWVTSRALAPGGVKEKRLIARYPDGGVRFQGEIVAPDGIVLDRTTLTPQPGGGVRQIIETSRDGGAAWVVGFDGVYEPAGKTRP